MIEEEKQYENILCEFFNRTHSRMPKPQEFNLIGELAKKYSNPVEAEVKQAACERCNWIIKQLEKVIAYPTEEQGRRTEDGYPLEFSYDEFAYKRMIDSVRDALRNIIKDSISKPSV